MSIAGLMFYVGRKVEISLHQENRQAAWFPATIQQHLGNETYMVECLGANTDNSTNTKIVDSFHLRPCPPLLKYKNFVLLEKVDAFFEFGWWCGIIKQECENNSYLIFFQQLNMEKKFDQSQLRPHMDWKDGKWFTSSQDISTPSSEVGLHVHLVCENLKASVPTVPVNNLGDGKDAFGGKTSDQVDDSPEFQKIPHVTSLTKRRKHSSDSQELHDISIKEMMSGSLSSFSGVIVNTVEKQSAQADCSSDNPSWEKRTRMQRNAGSKINSLSNAKNSRAKMSQVENSEFYPEGKETYVVDYTAEDVQNEHTKTGFEVPLVIGLPSAKMVSRESGLSGNKKRRDFKSNNIVKIGSEEKQQLGASTTKKIELSETVDFRKRGRSRKTKTPIKYTRTPATDYSNQKDDDPRIIPEAMEISPVANQEKTTLNRDKPINGQSDAKGRKIIYTRKREEKAVEVSTNLQENHLPKRRRHNTILQLQENGEKKHIDSAVVNRVYGNHQASEVPILAIVDKPAVVPFVKNNTLLWKTLEAMEAFRKIPQNPHFQPLQHIKESLREGKALGFMVSFASVVGRISELQFGDSKGVADDILEVLANLEMYGFNVRPVHDRVAELLAVKQKELDLVGQVTELNERIMGCDREKIRIEKEMDEIRDEIRKMEERLLIAEKVREKEEGGLAVLGDLLEETEESIENVRTDFKGIVCSRF